VNTRSQFEALTGRTPFLWQERFYDFLTRGRFADLARCDIPTGLGKTSVVALWLMALAAHPERIPRRLVYVVNRRTVVDQTTAEILRLRENLAPAGIYEPLEALCTPGIPRDRPLAISTLRGLLADNREWSSDPCRAAVIVGTVDLMGSRLLFRGYRAGFKTRPLHAAFLGQDTLIVHDEAHLEPAFQKLILAVEREQRAMRDLRPLKVIALSATTRRPEGVPVVDPGPDESPTFKLTAEESGEPGVAKRLNAIKLLRLHPLDDPKRLAEKLAELAFQHQSSDAAVLVFARTVETVEATVNLLRKKAGRDHVLSLTGVMRGQERDKLVEAKVFRRFLPLLESDELSSTISGAVYLVCTSAGEVGVNISADHLVCDLATYESMAQRFGRVNRFGLRENTVVDVVHPTNFKEPDEMPLRKTLSLLKSLPGTVNSAALSALPEREREEAFSLLPQTLETSGILFDAWAMTSIKDALPGRPSVARYLHGLNDLDPPATELVWREEVGEVRSQLRAEYEPDDLLEDYPVKPHEILRLPSDRAWKHLQKIAQRCPDQPLWLVDGENPAVFLALRDLLDKRKDKTFVEHRMVFLPPAAGGMDEDGFMDGDSETASDVADQPGRRQRTWNEDEAAALLGAGMQLVRKLEFAADPEEEVVVGEDPDAESVAVARIWWWLERPETANSASSVLAKAAVPLAAHNKQVATFAASFAKGLNLGDDFVAALRIAGEFHDSGKARVQWQQSIGNFNSNETLAKPDERKKTPPSYGFYYRHEFGSVLDLANAPEMVSLSDEMQDLTLHLIAAHHGRARPHFTPDEALDPERARSLSVALAAEAPRRFARLQRRYGRWGLAFLESLLRAADYAVSARPTSLSEDPQP
jgi:CRISPR-associated endonuclease/helicase Cas3